ncbi:MAG: MFS transporter [Pseudomonadota bacterium]
MTEQVRQEQRALRISCAAHIVQDGLTATIYVLLPVLAQTYGFTYAQVGLFKALKSIAQGLPEIASGFLTERMGEIRVLVFGLLLGAVGYAALSVAPGAGAVLAALLLIGVGTALHHAPSSSLILTTYPVDRRRGPLGLYNSSGDIGKLLFSGGFSFTVGAGLAWEAISFSYGLIALGGAVFIALASRSLTAFRNTEAAAADLQPNDLGWGILNWRSFNSLLAVVFVDTLVQAGVLVFAAFLLLDKGLPLTVATAGTVMLLLGGIFGKAGCGYLADRIGVRPAFAVIQILTGAALVGLVLLPGWWAMALLVPLGVVVQGSSSITYGFAADLIHPKRMARGYALLYSSSSFSAAAGPLMVGYFADGAGIGIAFYVMAAASIVAIPPIYMLSAGRPDAAPA